jgi:hypothetical protein
MLHRKKEQRAREKDAELQRLKAATDGLTDEEELNNVMDRYSASQCPKINGPPAARATSYKLVPTVLLSTVLPA